MFNNEEQNRAQMSCVKAALRGVRAPGGRNFSEIFRRADFNNVKGKGENGKRAGLHTEFHAPMRISHEQ